MEVIKFDPYHLKLINMQQLHVDELFPNELMMGAANIADKYGYSFTAVENNVIIGCAGLVETYPGVADAWAIFSEWTPRKMFAIGRVVKRHTDFWLNTFRRLQFMCIADSIEANRFARFLGFTKEGVSRAYGPDGKDYCLYSKIRGDI